MATTSACPVCGGPLFSGALGNRCPRCLMGLGLSDPDGTAELTSSGGLTRFGDYQLLEEVGRGGMGVVYRARQISLNRIVAIKMLLARPFAVPELEARLHLEAEAAAGLNHPSIVTIYDFGECDNQFYFSMEYVEGRSLAEATRHHSLGPTQAVRYLKAVAEAVHHAHENGILHRDLKPSNILIDLNDQVKVTDFGLAKRLGTESELTLTGQTVGSPNYLSPEQAAGKQQALTVRSDVYSLGAVLYQLLTARPPLVGESLQETLVQIREKEVPSPRLLNARVPRDLETICLKCLQKEPGRRYDSAQALAADLGRFLEGKPILARPVSTAGRVWRWSRRNPALAGALVGCAVALLLGILGIAWQWNRAQTQARVAQRNLYGADMLLAQQALEQGDLGRAKDLLDGHRPRGKAKNRKQIAETDLRGWEWRYLWSQCQSDERLTLFRGPYPVTALALLSDGSQLAVRRDPTTVMLWDTRNRRMLSQQSATPWFKALAASPRSQLLAWGTQESNGAPSVLLWDAGLNREVVRLPHGADVVSLAFSADAQRLATLTRDAEISVWDVASQHVAARFQVRTNLPPIREGSHYSCVLFSPTDRLLAVGMDRALIQLVDWVSGAAKDIALAKPADGVTTMAFTPDGKWLALGGGYFDNSIHLYELATGTWSRLEGHKGWIVCLAFAPDGQVLASAGADQTIRLWDVRQGVESKRFQGHEDEVYFVAWTPDGRQLVSGGKDGSVRCWDPDTTFDKLGYAVLPKPAHDLAFAPNCESLVTLSQIEEAVIVRDPRTLQEVGRLSTPGSFLRRLALAEDGRRLAVGGAKGKVQVWDLEARRPITNLVVGPRWIQSLQFSRAGDRLLCVCRGADNKRVLRLYDTVLWGSIDLQGISLGDLCDAILSPSGRTLAISHLGGAVSWWELKTRQRQALFHWPHLGVETTIAFSPDERWFAAGGEGSVLMLLRVVDREVRQIARAHLNQSVGLAFSPDSRRLITSGTGGKDTLKVWDVESSRDIATLGGQPGFYDRIGFSPDGNTLFAVGNQGTVLLWRARSSEQIAALEQAEERSP